MQLGDWNLEPPEDPDPTTCEWCNEETVHILYGEEECMNEKCEGEPEGP